MTAATTMELELRLHNGSGAEEDLHLLTSELQASINGETAVTASIPVSTPQPGKKGDPVSIGTLLLSFISSGAAVAFFNVIKSYMERDSSLEVTLQKSDGSSITIKSSNLSQDKINETLAQMDTMLNK